MTTKRQLKEALDVNRIIAKALVETIELIQEHHPDRLSLVGPLSIVASQQDVGEDGDVMGQFDDQTTDYDVAMLEEANISYQAGQPVASSGARLCWILRSVHL